ncbi:hypothetical protein CSA08_04835 [Candidatus Gracilibacteria bacterium]|nr:MAG: hypothetical protein CSA08_04835 [Candidatus Gracilibacteria bacterium]
MNINDLLELNKKLSLWRIIYFKYTINAKIISIVISLFVLAFFICWVIFNRYIEYLSFLLGLFFIYILFSFLRKNNIKVIESQHNMPVTNHKIFTPSLDIIMKNIVKKELDKNLLTNDNINFMINILKRHYENNKKNIPLLYNL